MSNIVEKLRADGVITIAEWDAIRNSAAAEIERLTAEVERLRAALKDCADDLEASVNAEYAGTRDYPSQESRYQRDMRPVYAARHLLAAYQQTTTNEKR